MSRPTKKTDKKAKKAKAPKSIKNEDKPWMKLAGCIEGAEDASTTVDEVVYGERDRP